MREPRSKGREGLVLYCTSLMHPFLFKFHSFCSSERQAPEIQCSIPMIFYQTALQYRSHSSHTPFRHVCSRDSTDCFTQMVSLSISAFLFPAVTERWYKDATPQRTIILISPSVPCCYNLPGQHIQLIASFLVQEKKVQNHMYPSHSFCNCKLQSQHHVLVTNTNDKVLHCNIQLKPFVENPGEKH